MNCHARAWLYTAICLSAAADVVLLALVPYIVTYCRDKPKLKWNRITNGGNTNTTTPHTAIEAGNNAYNTEPSAPLTENSPLIQSIIVDGRPPPYRTMKHPLLTNHDLCMTINLNAKQHAFHMVHI